MFSAPHFESLTSPPPYFQSSSAVTDMVLILNRKRNRLIFYTKKYRARLRPPKIIACTGYSTQKNRAPKIMLPLPPPIKNQKVRPLIAFSHSTCTYLKSIRKCIKEGWSGFAPCTGSQDFYHKWGEPNPDSGDGGSSHGCQKFPRCEGCTEYQEATRGVNQNRI